MAARLFWQQILNSKSEFQREVQRGEAPLLGVWGCPPTLNSPKSGGQGVE